MAPSAGFPRSKVQLVTSPHSCADRIPYQLRKAARGLEGHPRIAPETPIHPPGAAPAPPLRHAPGLDPAGGNAPRGDLDRSSRRRVRPLRPPDVERARPRDEPDKRQVGLLPAVLSQSFARRGTRQLPMRVDASTRSFYRTFHKSNGARVVSHGSNHPRHPRTAPSGPSP